LREEKDAAAGQEVRHSEKLVFGAANLVRGSQYQVPLSWLQPLRQRAATGPRVRMAVDVIKAPRSRAAAVERNGLECLCPMMSTMGKKDYVVLMPG